jgi:hypothetical protein
MHQRGVGFSSNKFNIAGLVVVNPSQEAGLDMRGTPKLRSRSVVIACGAARCFATQIKWLWHPHAKGHIPATPCEHSFSNATLTLFQCIAARSMAPCSQLESPKGSARHPSGWRSGAIAKSSYVGFGAFGPRETCLCGPAGGQTPTPRGYPASPVDPTIKELRATASLALPTLQPPYWRADRVGKRNAVYAILPVATWFWWHTTHGGHRT